MPSTQARPWSRSVSLDRLGFKSYKEYLASDLWATIRRRIMVRDSQKCKRCGKFAEHVHHLAYGIATLAGSNDSNLIAICRDCHHSIEFDGDRKRTRSEVRSLDRGKTKVISKKEKLNRKPATAKQVARIGEMLEAAGLPRDESRLKTLTNSGFTEWATEINKALQVKRKQHAASEHAACDKLFR